MNSKERINDLVKRSGLSRRALAIRYGIPDRTIQNWSYGVTEAPQYVLDMLERLIEIDFEKEGK